MVAALAVFPEKREVELELSMLNILRAITSPESCPNNNLLSALLIVESVHSIPVAGTYAGSLL